MKNILFASSECVPFIKTGGLADVVGSLPKDFDKEKYDCRVVLPKYMCMKQEWVDRLGISQTSTWILQERIAMSESLRQN